MLLINRKMHSQHKVEFSPWWGTSLELRTATLPPPTDNFNYLDSTFPICEGRIKRAEHQCLKTHTYLRGIY